MSRPRYNNQSGTLGAALTSGGTTITFAVAPGFATISGSDTIAITLEPGTANEEIVSLTAYTAAATTGTISRAAEGVTLGTAGTAVAHANGVSWVHGPTVVDFTPAGIVLAKVVYNPNPFVDLSTTSTSFVAIDATNLTITFTAPPSGNVDVEVEGTSFISVGSGSGNIYWAVKVGSGAAQLYVRVLGTNGAIGIFGRSRASFPLTALTPGTSYTVTPMWMIDGSTTGHFYEGNTGTTTMVGPAILRAVASL